MSAQPSLFADLTPAEILGLPGFAEAVTLYLTPPKRECLTSWSLLTAYLLRQSRGAGTETFRVLFLDHRNQLIADEVMGRGTINHAPVYPREVTKRALALDAGSVILTHNHPAGDPKASRPDIEMTHKIVEALKPFGISVHDHVITAGGQAVSMRSQGIF